MAVQSDTSRISYAGNNSTSTSYAVPFVFLENTHLKAIAKTSAGVESVVTLTNHTGAGSVNGGTVRTAVAVPATSTLTIYRDVPITQTTTYAEGGDFPAASHERALDKLTQISQQNARKLGSALRLSEANQIGELNPPLTNQQHILSSVGGAAPSWQALPSLSIGPVIATGSTTARSVQDRFADVTNVRDFGASPFNAGSVNRAAIQAAIDYASSGSASLRCVYFPSGFYQVDDTLFVRTDSVNIVGASRSNTAIQGTHANNILVFEPSAAGTSNVFLNSCSLQNIQVTRTGTFNSAVGTTVWVRQCNGFTAEQVTANEGNECFRITGGQLNSFSGCNTFVSNSTIQATNDSGCWVFEEAVLSGGAYQPCYTVNITDFRASASKILNNIFYIRSADGLQISNGYCAFASESLFHTKRQRAGTNVTAINVSNAYFDCVDAFGGGITGTPTAVLIAGTGLGAGQYGATALTFSNCIMANNDDTGSFNSLINIVKYCNAFTVSHCYIANNGSPYAVQIFDSTESAPKGSYSFVGNHFSNLSNASSGGAIYIKDVSQSSIVGNNFEFISSASWAALFDGTIDSTTIIGNTCDNTPTDFVVFANGMTINDNVVLLNAGLPSSGKNVVRLALPTSDTGLPSGSMWNDGGTVKVKA
jgi:hypothetical protein